MDKVAHLAGLLGSFNKQPSVFFTAKVVSIQGDSCTIEMGDMEVTEVRLKATINNSANHALIIPAPGSFVLVGSISGDLKDLAVLVVDQIQKVAIHQNGLQVEIDATDNKVRVKNNDASLYDLFNSLADIIKTLKVYTPSGVSGTAIPTSVAKLTKFETDFKKLLK